MITAAFRLLKLGPVVGQRTWGGVVGMTGRHRLGDGTVITVPMNAAWFDTYGWSVENHGVEPDLEALRTPWTGRRAGTRYWTTRSGSPWTCWQRTPGDTADVRHGPEQAAAAAAAEVGATGRFGARGPGPGTRASSSEPRPPSPGGPVHSFVGT